MLYLTMYVDVITMQLNITNEYVPCILPMALIVDTSLSSDRCTDGGCRSARSMQISCIKHLNCHVGLLHF